MGWTSFLGNSRRLGVAPGPVQLPLALLWKHKIGEYVWGSAAIDNGTAYIPGRDVWSLDLDTGGVNWRAEGVRAFGTTSPAVEGDRLFVCATEALFCLQVETGQTIYTLPQGSRDSSPCVVGKYVMWPGLDGSVYAAAIDSGALAWHLPTNFSDAIRFTAGSDGEFLFYADYRGVHAHRLDSGDTAWHWEYGGGLEEPVGATAVLDELLLIAVRDLGLIALEKGSGREVWRRRTERGPFTGPCVSQNDGVAYVASTKLHAVSIASGREIWSSDKFGFADSNPIVVGGHILIGGGYDRRLYAFERASGVKVWEYLVGDLVFSSPAYAEGRLVIGCHDGYIYCFEGADR